MARLIGNIDATGSLTTSIPGEATNSSAVSLYAPFDSNINDTSDHGHTGTAIGNATISSTQAKFGSNSAYFDGSGDVITYPRDTAFQLGAGDFTIEAFVYRTSSPTYGTVAAMWTGSGNRRSFIFRFNGNNLYFYWSTSGNSSYSSQAFTDLSASLNTWHHVAFCRKGASGFVFLDGFKSNNTANLGTQTLYYPDVPLSIGALNTLSHSGGQNNYAGYIDDLRITKGIALYPDSFVPSSTAVGASLSGTNSTNTTTTFTSLYLPFDADLNDDSSDNVTVTALNGAAISSTQSKFGGSSLFLDGAGEMLTVPKEVLLPSAARYDFTVEMWVYPTTLVNGRLWSQWGAGSNRNFLIQTQSDGDVQVYIRSSGGTESQVTSSGGLAANTWAHVAVVRRDQKVILFIDGVEKGSISITGALSSYNSPIGIGGRGDSAAAFFAGYIDDLRVINGFALYTRNFTPRTSAATTSISQTLNDFAVLYMPFDNGLKDHARGHNVTAYGNAAISATQAKFGGKSLFIDATGDYLSIPNNGAFNFGLNDFTISLFIRPDDVDTSDQTSSVATILDNDSDAGTSGAWFSLHQKNAGLTFSSSNGQSSFTTSDCLSAATWHHVAVSRVGSTTTVYCDGVSVGSTSTAGNFSDTATRNLYIGKQNNSGSVRRFDGYIDDLLIVKGFGKVYSAAPTAAQGFEVFGSTDDTRTFSSVWNLNSAVVAENFKAGNWPTLPLDTQYTRLYLPYDSDANDDSSNAYTASSSNHGSSGSISSTQAKFGGNSAYFSSANAGYRYGTGGAFDLGSNDFTIRFWLYKTAANGAFLDYRSGSGGSGSGNESYGWLVHPNGFYFAGVGWPMMSFSDLANNQWQHIAVTRSGSSFRLFVDGVQQGSTVTSSSANGSSSGNAVLQVGAQYDSSYGLTGYIDDLQIDVGYAAYTAAFTPPSSPHGGGV